jgi:AraC-like DNA-binding protein
LQKTDSGAAAPNRLESTPKGLVDPLGARSRIALRRYRPSEALAPFVDYFWIVQWDLGEAAPQVQRVLPYPNAHLVFETGACAIHGVVRGAFERGIAGAGRTFGVRFRPGGLRPLLDRPMAALSDRTLAIDAVFKITAAQAEQRVLGESDDAAMIIAAEAIVLPVLPEPDPRTAQVERVLACAAANDGPASVAALCAQAELGERALQRLFAEYVGVSPKWVIQRYRLQEAMWRLSAAEAPDLAGMAQELGFCDQAHFTHAYTALVGQSPLSYWQSQQAGHGAASS